MIYHRCVAIKVETWRENVLCAARERTNSGKARQKRQEESHHWQINLMVTACKFKTWSFADGLDITNLADWRSSLTFLWRQPLPRSASAPHCRLRNIPFLRSRRRYRSARRTTPFVDVPERSLHRVILRSASTEGSLEIRR